MIESTSEIFSTMAQFTLIIFVISFFWIIRTVTRENHEYVSAQAEWWIFPWVDVKAGLNFFIWAYPESAKIKDSKLLVRISAISFFLTVGSVIGFIASVTVEGLQ
jgi:hypothetical protein